jgi:hypothetical protein
LFLLFRFVLFSYTLLPRSHFQRFTAFYPGRHCASPPEKFVGFDLAFSFRNLPLSCGTYGHAGAVPAMPAKTG